MLMSMPLVSIKVGFDSRSGLEAGIVFKER